MCLPPLSRTLSPTLRMRCNIGGVHSPPSQYSRHRTEYRTLPCQVFQGPPTRQVGVGGASAYGRTRTGMVLAAGCSGVTGYPTEDVHGQVFARKPTSIHVGTLMTTMERNGSWLLLPPVSRCPLIHSPWPPAWNIPETGEVSLEVVTSLGWGPTSHTTPGLHPLSPSLIDL